MGVFADRGGEVVLCKAEFADNRTGIKADNNSKVSMTYSSVRGCEWDGVWCGGNAGLLLEFNIFASNRHGIKEDGPCVVTTTENKFKGSGAADHLVWPRIP
jgi:hypothetical protein